MRILEVKNWKKVALDREEWAKLLKKARAHQGLSSQWWWKKFIYLISDLFRDAVSDTEGEIVNNELQTRENKRSWPIVNYYTVISPIVLSKTTKTFQYIVILADLWTWLLHKRGRSVTAWRVIQILFNTLRTGDADLRFYITTVRDGWRKSAFLTRACFPCTIHLIM